MSERSSHPCPSKRKPETVAISLVIGLVVVACQAHAKQLLIDIGKGGPDLAEGYVAGAADEAYSSEKGCGWVAEEEGVVRFCYSGDFRDPEKWRKHATQVEGNSKLISPAKRMRGTLGAFPFDHEGSFVYEFVFPAPIRTLEIRDTHVIWGGGRPKPNSVTMWTSHDGTNWTVRHKDRPRYYVQKYHEDLSEAFRGKRRLYVKYHFYAGNKNRPAYDPRGACISDFCITGTLSGKLPTGFSPDQCIASLSAGQYSAGPCQAEGDALAKDGANVVHRATFRADLPAGKYYVETVSNTTSYSLLVEGRPIHSPNIPTWRSKGKARTVAGRAEHAGGPLTLSVRTKGEEVHLQAIRFLGDPGSRFPARFGNGKIVLDQEPSDPAVREGLRVLREANFVHSPDVTQRAMEAFRKAKEEHEDEKNG